jgi:hypothetical protein
MRHWLLITLSLTLAFSSFGQISALGEKSAYLHAHNLEPISLWDLADIACMCGHLQWYPNDKIPHNKKLVVGVKNGHPKATEFLFIVENNEDVENSMQCGRDYVSYYFIGAHLI